MKNFLYLILLLFFLTGCEKVYMCEISGYIYDKNTNGLMGNVSITLGTGSLTVDNPIKSIKTDTTGYYLFEEQIDMRENNRENNYYIRFEHIGYKKQEIFVTFDKYNTQKTINIYLVKN